MIIRRDDAFRVICEIRTTVSATQERIGTGMFVSSPVDKDAMYGWIVTANHVAKDTNSNTHIIMATEDGKAESIPLTEFGPLSNWKHHTIADISAFQIVFTIKNREYMKNRFFPLDHINLERKAVSRDYELTAIGFPNGLGVGAAFSPLSFRSFASSSFVTLPRADTKTPSDFFCLENPSVGGYSGCPVFDLGYETNGIMTVTRKKTWCHGFMHGTMSDETGGKIAIVTPAFYLKDII